MADEEEPNAERFTAAATTHATPATSFASVNAKTNTTSKAAATASTSPPAVNSRTPDASTKQPQSRSQLGTANTSNNSLPVDQAGSTATDPKDVSPYGTRSRNRNGSSRPNYAEEPEINDYEYALGKKSQAPSETVSAGAHAPSDVERTSGANTRRSSNAAPTVPTPPTTIPKNTTGNMPSNQMPGMSSFAINTTTSAPPAPTRKRKTPGSGPGAPQHASAHTQTSAIGPPRRQATATAANSIRTTCLMTFEGCKGYLKNGKLKADDGTVLAVGDQIYAICEPPGDPYYLGRILEFIHANNDHSQPVDDLKVNWFLRPRDISRKVNDTRLLFASFQTGTTPIGTLRGKCQVRHRSEISDLDAYRKSKDSFWYEKLFDRYIHRFYEVIPISQVINVPEKVKKVLDERWKYVVVEIGRGKELTSAIKSCKRCTGYCASSDSVDCAVCKNTYHMSCVRPPLAKKPARGFGWSCAPCSRRQERRLEARNTPNQAGDGDEEEVLDEEEDDNHLASQHGTQSKSGDFNSLNSGNRPPTAEQLALSKLWPYRYLGLHCKVEDALDYDDRIYPRASSRLGPKHQATVHAWPGRPVRYVKSKETKRRHWKSTLHKKEIKPSKETTAAIEAERAAKETRPIWIEDEPPGFTVRGEDHPNGDPKNTAQLVFGLPQTDESSSTNGELSSRGEDAFPADLSQDQRLQLVEDYMNKAKTLANDVGVSKFSTNFLDKALELLTANNYQSDKALNQLQHVKKRKDLKEPELTKEELKRFEDGVSKYGSQLGSVSRHVGKSQKPGEIVRFYYMWKKTSSGQQIWNNYDGRKGKKQAKQTDTKLLDDVADDVDDSAFDNDKAAARKRGFVCKFCSTRQSPQWRRAPQTQPGTLVPADPSVKTGKDKSGHLMLALCQRCGGLWRKYGIQWEDINEVAKKVASAGGRAWKRRIDEELLSELLSANVSYDISMNKTTADAAAAIGMEIPSNLMIQHGQEGSKKRQKLALEPQMPAEPLNGVMPEPVKKKEPEKPVEPPAIPDDPHIRLLPCAVCYEFQPAHEQLLICRHCRLTVHRNCYGVSETKSSDKWTCDMCINDLSSMVSTTYECILCTVIQNTDTDVAILMDPPKVSHKKKTDREREKERIEKELIEQAAEIYFNEQERKGRPKTPRQPLKRTSGNNWVHVVCATFHPEIKFSDPKALEFAEGFAIIPSAKQTQKCKQCKSTKGACVNCVQCQAAVHVACAQQFGYSLVFDLNPVKQSRKDAVNTVGMGGEFGSATAVVYCREHAPKHKTHRLNEMDEDSPLNALQRYVRTHKQADISQTGTQRKAMMVQNATRAAAQSAEAGSTRGAAAAAANAGTGNNAAPLSTRSSRVSPSAVTIQSEEVDEDGDRVIRLSDAPAIESAFKECQKCGTTASPKFHLIPPRTGQASGTQATQASAAQSRMNSDHDRTEMITQPTDAPQNGLLNGHRSSHSQDHNGDVVILDAIEHGSALSATRPSGAADENFKVEKEDRLMTSISQEGPNWLCHKCHLRKIKNPTPPRIPTPQPDPAPNPVEASEPEPSSPQVSVPWPAQAPVAVPPPPPPEPYRRWSNGPAEPAYHGPDHVPNGVPHSPVVPPPPPPAAHYGPPPAAVHRPPPPPPPPPTYGPPPPSYPYRADSRDRSHSYSRPSAHYQPPPAHGLSGGYEPPSFQYRRDATGNLVQVPYIPPGTRGQPPPPNPPLRSPQSAHRIRSPHLRSPQVQSLPPPTHHMTPPTRHTRSPPVSEQGPHGPPEADSNPFASPYGSHNSPYYVRPGTPEYPPRDGRWPSERPMTNGGNERVPNGASESPHLRNLLH